MLQEQVDRRFGEHRNYLYQLSGDFQNSEDGKGKSAAIRQYRRAIDHLEGQINCLLSYDVMIRGLKEIDLKLIDNEPAQYNGERNEHPAI